MTCPSDTSALRPVVVVLGSGRSGTSLLMQVLAALGLRVSDQLIAARQDNPQGFYEDARIVRIQADLMRALGAWPFHPLPADWLQAPATVAAGEALAEVLRERLDHPRLWGFKDPRTAPFLPLWQRLFNELQVAPRYLLALREPGSIIRSFMTAYACPAETAEQVWLQRTCEALWHTQAHCHIVHYEDWFSRGPEMARELARFTGLAVADHAALNDIIRPDLDRSRMPDYVLAHPAARELNAALQTCRGDAFDREQLLQVVDRCRAAQ
jgi:hypothetical protein